LDLPIKDFLPEVRRLQGKNLCRQNDIQFVCLPANSTDKMQPLDVGLFAPMKANWRKQLRAYAEKDPSHSPLNKIHFPRMLKELMQSLNAAELLPKAYFI